MEQGDTVDEGAELVQSLMAPAPSAPFILKRAQPDGTFKDFPIRMQVLRREEALMVLQDAQSEARKRGEVSKEYGDIYKEEQAAALLARSIRRPKQHALPSGAMHYPPLFTSSRQLNESFTENEMAQCLNAYEITKAMFSCVEDFRESELDKWAVRLSDTLLGPLELSRLDSAHWLILLSHMAQEVRSLRAEVGRPLSTSLDSSESSPSSSETGTGGSTPSQDVPLSGPNGEPIETPSNRLLLKEEAKAIAKEKLRK